MFAAVRYKNFRCDRHNKFFEVNLYQKNLINAHHGRANLARPSTDIDLSLKKKAKEKRPGVKTESITLPPNSTSEELGSKALSPGEEVSCGGLDYN